MFAPTDAAFASLLTELNVTKAQLLANKPLLVKVLTYHVVAGRVLEADVPVGAPITTAETGTFTVDASLKITDARGRKANIARQTCSPPTASFTSSTRSFCQPPTSACARRASRRRNDLRILHVGRM